MLYGLETTFLPHSQSLSLKQFNVSSSKPETLWLVAALVKGKSDATEGCWTKSEQILKNNFAVSFQKGGNYDEAAAASNSRLVFLKDN